MRVTINTRQRKLERLLPRSDFRQFSRVRVEQISLTVFEKIQHGTSVVNNRTLVKQSS